VLKAATGIATLTMIQTFKRKNQQTSHVSPLHTG